VNAGDPNPCTTGYIQTTELPSPGAVQSADVNSVRCDVVNGVDPSPGDGYDESGSDIRGEQNIGRSGGTGSNGPSSAAGGGSNPLAGVGGDVLGQLLHANPFASTVG
jgi:hypothetical protein